MCRSMKRDSIRVPATQLIAMVARLFASAGLDAAAAERVAEGLVEADREGLPSHGVMLVDMYIARLRSGSVSLDTAARIVSDRDAAIVLDAGHALGQLTGEQAMSLATDRAKLLGAAVVAVRHGFHFGTARRYAQWAADAGCIGIAMCNTRPLMPAPGGAERVVGNNPLAIAIPHAGPIPIVLDMATSEAAMGKIRMADKAGRRIPDNWALKADGTPTTNAAEAIAGMLLPSGGPKGFGLAFTIDLICGLLSGGAIGDGVQPLYGDFAVPYDCSHLFIAIDVAHFCDLDVFRARAAAAAEHVRTSRRAPGIDALFSPGEPEWRTRESSGDQVLITAAVAEMLVRTAGELGVSSAPLNTFLEQAEVVGHAQA